MSSTRAVRMYPTLRRMADDHRTPRNEAASARARAHELWNTYAEVRGENPLRRACPELVGFSWELSDALDALWTPRTLDKPEGLDLTELRWWLEGYDFKELRNLLALWRKREADELVRAREEHQATRGYCPPCDLRRLNVLEWTIEQAYREAFRAEAGEYPVAA